TAAAGFDAGAAGEVGKLAGVRTVEGLRGGDWSGQPAIWTGCGQADGRRGTGHQGVGGPVGHFPIGKWRFDFGRRDNRADTEYSRGGVASGADSAGGSHRMSEKIRVLVVDDSALMRKLIPQVLQRDPSIE